MNLVTDKQKHSCRREAVVSTKPLSVMKTPTILPDTHQSQVAQLAEALMLYHQQKFTGRVDISIAAGQQYSLYISLGNIVWASGGLHPVRRWRRLLACHCPQVNANNISLRQADRFECWDYHILTILTQRQVVTDEQILALVGDLVAEVLFDLIQILERQPGSAHQPFNIQARIGMRPSDTNTCILRRKWTLEMEPTLAQVQQAWEQWTRAGFAAWLPDLAPAIAQPEKLQQQTPEKVYKNLAALANGKHSLRDLAVLTKRDVLGLARSLFPYLRQKLMKLGEIPDLQLPKNSAPSQSERQSRRGIVACIDDNPKVCSTLNNTIGKAGYECLTIQDPLQAVPKLIQSRPDVIFLDLAMPVINGYELCSQIRRISSFQNTPIIILTSNDGIVDRVRAKIVGATDFLNKPVEARKVLDAVRRYCSAPQNPDQPTQQELSLDHEIRF
jgi:two-component system, chemotaxis family, response regulator PixG